MHGGLETEVDKADAKVPEYGKDEVGIGEGCLSWETKLWKVAISSLDIPSSEGPEGTKAGAKGVISVGVEVTEWV